MSGAKKILVVEDEAVIRSICRRILAPLKHDAVFASGIREAAEKIDSSHRFDLLITDMRLPDGDGLEAISLFRERNARAAILIMTGSPNPGARADRLQEAGLDEKDILAKPFEIKDFESLVRRKLEEAE